MPFFSAWISSLLISSVRIRALRISSVRPWMVRIGTPWIGAVQFCAARPPELLLGPVRLRALRIGSMRIWELLIRTVPLRPLRTGSRQILALWCCVLRFCSGWNCSAPVRVLLFGSRATIPAPVRVLLFGSGWTCPAPVAALRIGLVQICALLVCLATLACAARGTGHDIARDPAGRAATDAARETAQGTVLRIFEDNIVHFTPDEPGRYDTVQVEASDDGRVINRFMEMRFADRPARILARVRTRPIPKDIQEVHDKWDRAGSVRLHRPGSPDVELVKFITAYGGETEHVVDISHLAPLLDGPCTFKGFVDTWVSPGWRMDFSLEIDSSTVGRSTRGVRPRFREEESTEEVRREGPLRWIDSPRDWKPPVWVLPLFHEEQIREERLRDGPLRWDVAVPAGIDRVSLHYLVSGHCTDGRGADEFETKDHVIFVDGSEVHRLRPWRDDCLRFRAINPYCRRWSDGSWSSDYSRSGWCPGDKVMPLVIDLSKALTPGRHTIALDIRGIRPRDEEGHFGYWRASAYLVGEAD